MSTDDGTPRYSPSWLGLRERADADARCQDLLEPLRDHLNAAGRPVLHDLGCGTGSMARWVARQLPLPQHWIMHDRDPELLEHAAAQLAGSAAGAAPVTVETRQGDLTQLTARDLRGANLITASALLDLLTTDEVRTLASACVEAGAPVLFALSVLGRVEFDPVDPLDRVIAAAFNAHQRRVVGGRRLLGPDAVDAAVEAFEQLNRVVRVQPSPWRLGAGDSALTMQWLRGWVAAAVEQEPDLTTVASAYLDRRLAAAQDGQLGVVVHHSDLLAL
jgi:hypothetical protein